MCFEEFYPFLFGGIPFFLGYICHLYNVLGGHALKQYEFWGSLSAKMMFFLVGRMFR